MKILRAAHLGMCFGVRDAITLARQEAAAGPVTVLGDLVHNETVLSQLRHQGVRFEPRLDTVQTPTVVITAHGASERRLAEVRDRGHRLIEATCPLVRFAHERLAALVRQGFHPVIVGQRNHVEVRGMTEDLAAFDVVLDDADVASVASHQKFGVVAQTTQPLSRVRHLLALLQTRFPDSQIQFADTVCLPTKRRQQAAEDIAAQSDVVVVVGGAHSNNTRELVATCRRFGARAHHVQTAGDLQPEWFQPGDSVGITAGTSTPDETIDAVEARLLEWAGTHSQPALAPSPREIVPVSLRS
ncbi:MAG: 4-hydroxy-3-methylbut-2-enyl diphosphate reductase [Verrucomicrobiae bacterium]|nr:4-hydroxy-3-methylbut-2-enyl diphosphate reductase [Verrucomicrobiae bacterium]